MREGLFSGVFARGEVDTGSGAWLRAMLDVEAALARALERAELAPAGAGSPPPPAARTTSPTSSPATNPNTCAT